MRSLAYSKMLRMTSKVIGSMSWPKSVFERFLLMEESSYCCSRSMIRAPMALTWARVCGGMTVQACSYSMIAGPSIWCWVPSASPS
ncbi:hypothetical protein D3C78_1744410 [compost metagenome]